MPTLPSPHESRSTIGERPRVQSGINMLGLKAARQHSMRTMLSDGTLNDADRIRALKETGEAGVRAPDVLLYKATSITQTRKDYRDEDTNVTSGGDDQLTASSIAPTKPYSLLTQQLEEVIIAEEPVVTSPVTTGTYTDVRPTSSSGSSSNDDEEEVNDEYSTVGGITRPPNSGPSEY